MVKSNRHYRNLALRILRGSVAVGDSDGMAMHNELRPVSNISQTFRFPALENKEGHGRYGLKFILNVCRRMSISVVWLALTNKTQIHVYGEPVFDITWWCRIHRMGHRQHLNLTRAPRALVGEALPRARAYTQVVRNEFVGGIRTLI